MILIENVGEARMAYEAAMGAAITEAFRNLFTEKHLYQSVTLDDEKTRRALPPMTETLKKHCENSLIFSRGVSQYPWMLRGDEGPQRPEDGRPGADVLPFSLPHVKLYCVHCNGREVFNVVAGGSTVKAWEYKLPVAKMVASHQQVYQLTYLCQSCRKYPEVFLVRRTGGRLTLCGRSEIEHVDVPGFVPTEIIKFYRNALLAHQSGQTLAANFMLRTAIEQWSILFLDAEVRGGAAVEAYNAALPDDFKPHFPSLYDLYSQLSEDIHAAEGSAELFVSMSAKFLEHFDARRLRKIPGPKT